MKTLIRMLGLCILLQFAGEPAESAAVIQCLGCEASEMNLKQETNQSRNVKNILDTMKASSRFGPNAQLIIAEAARETSDRQQKLARLTVQSQGPSTVQMNLSSIEDFDELTASQLAQDLIAEGFRSTSDLDIRFASQVSRLDQDRVKKRLRRALMMTLSGAKGPNDEPRQSHQFAIKNVFKGKPRLEARFDAVHANKTHYGISLTAGKDDPGRSPAIISVYIGGRLTGNFESTK